jgi:toxin YoeB
MQIDFTENADKDLHLFIKSGNKSILKKIAELIKSIEENPFEGIGKPEALKHEFSGKWSRRINQEHRIIYELQNGKILIHSLKGHY